MVSALSLAVIRLPPRRRGATGAAHSPMAGVGFLLRQPVLRSVALVLAGFSLITAGSFDLFVYHLERDLHQSEATLGLVTAVASLGGLLAATAGPWLRRRLGFGPCFLGGSALHGVALAALGAVPSAVAAAPVMISSNFAEVLKGMCSMSLRQQITPDALLGRVTAAFWVLTRVAAPVGATLSTALAARLGASTALLLSGTSAVVVALLGALTPARARSPEAGAQPSLPPPPAEATPAGAAR